MNLNGPAQKFFTLYPVVLASLFVILPLIAIATLVNNVHFLDLLMSAIVLVLFGNLIYQTLIRQSRRRHVCTHPFPAICMQKLRHHHPDLTPQQCAEVEQALRQFFYCHLASDFEFIAMPSKVVDDLWHEFILCTKDYERFCQHAFGRFFHHQPSGTLSASGKKMNEGLRRCWSHTCYLEEISPSYPSRLPKLFALDTRFHIANGFYYRIGPAAPSMEAAPAVLPLDKSAIQLAALPASIFIDSDIDGTTTGFVSLKREEEKRKRAHRRKDVGRDGGGGGGCGGGG